MASYVSFRDLSEQTAWDTASHIAPRNCSKELREEPGYLGAFTGERQHTHTCKHPTPTTQKKKKKENPLPTVIQEKRTANHKGRQVGDQARISTS